MSRSSTPSTPSPQHPDQPHFVRAASLRAVLPISEASAYRLARALGALRVGRRCLLVPLEAVRQRLGDEIAERVAAASSKR